jgi:hypothetical protein
MKLKSFYRLDKKGNPIPGSNIRRLSKPTQTGRWLLAKNICCLTPSTPACTCDFRYWIQIDYAGNPIDHTLIKRKKRPENVSNRFMEVFGICCEEG